MFETKMEFEEAKTGAINSRIYVWNASQLYGKLGNELYAGSTVKQDVTGMIKKSQMGLCRLIYYDNG